MNRLQRTAARSGVPGIRRVLLAASLLGAVLCTPALAARPAPALEGVYPLEDKNLWLSDLKSALRLRRDGSFSYTTLCFSGDVIMTGSTEGRYVVKDGWLTLNEGPGHGRGEDCTYIKRAYIVVERGETLLLWDVALAAAVQNGTVPQAWRRGRPPLPYTKKLDTWLPAPYRRHVHKVQLSGTVSALGEEVAERILAPTEQYYRYTPVGIDLGTDDGVFEGMWVCGPDKRRQFIRRVAPRTATLRWSGPVTLGTPVSADCPPL